MSAVAAEQLLRAASALAESGQAVRRLAPGIAGDYEAAAMVLRTIAAAAPLLAPASADIAPATGPISSTTRQALPKNSKAKQAEREAIVRHWIRNRAMNWSDDKPWPSVDDDVAAAAIELQGLGITQKMVRDHRWAPWRRAPGRPSKSKPVNYKSVT